jgi:uncharacterized protein (DUF2235 family)
LNKSTIEDAEVILIGFSRGAFTVRCVAQFMYEVGLLTKSGLRHLPKLFKFWKQVKVCKKRDTNWIELERRKKDLVAWGELLIEREAICIKACAVWDTVSAIGIPMPGQIPQFGRKKYRTVNNIVPDNIELAIQALALDETRRRFKPMIWSKRSLNKDDPSLIQCWFAGQHSDVGGGTNEITLANITLAWMVGQLTDKIQFNKESLWAITTTRAWSKPSPNDIDLELNINPQLQDLIRSCKVVASSPITSDLCK